MKHNYRRIQKFNVSGIGNSNNRENQKIEDNYKSQRFSVKESIIKKCMKQNSKDRRKSKYKNKERYRNNRDKKKQNY